MYDAEKGSCLVSAWWEQMNVKQEMYDVSKGTLVCVCVRLDQCYIIRTRKELLDCLPFPRCFLFSLPSFLYSCLSIGSTIVQEKRLFFSLLSLSLALLSLSPLPSDRRERGEDEHHILIYVGESMGSISLAYSPSFLRWSLKDNLFLVWQHDTRLDRKPIPIISIWI